MRPKCIAKPTKEQWDLTAFEFEKTAISRIAEGTSMGNIFE